MGHLSPGAVSLFADEKEITSRAEFVYVDLETTGKNYDEDVILEVAVAVTDIDGNFLATYRSLVDSGHDIFGLMPPLVREMHEKSGLLAEWLEMHRAGMHASSGVSSLFESDRVEWVILNFLKRDCGLASGEFAISGNSVHFDRRFIERHMPRLNDFFHYRHIDMSTLKQLCRKLNKPVAAAYEQMVAERDGLLTQHRALDDVKASIREYKFYKDNFLFVA